MWTRSLTSCKSCASVGSLVDLAKSRAGLDDDEAGYIASIPATLQEGIRATIAQAVDAGKAVHIMYSPAYEFGVQMWDYGQAVSIHLSGPYPDGFERSTK